MGCPRCGQNRGSGQIAQAPVAAPRPGTVPAMPRPQTPPVRINPADAVRNAIGGLRYVPK